MGLLIAIWVYCKFLSPKFNENQEIIYSSNVTTDTFSLVEYNRLCFTKLLVGEGKTIDINLDGTVLKLIPLKLGVKVSVNIGEITVKDNNEEKVLKENESFDVTFDTTFYINDKIIVLKYQSLNFVDDNFGS